LRSARAGTVQSHIAGCRLAAALSLLLPFVCVRAEGVSGTSSVGAEEPLLVREIAAGVYLHAGRHEPLTSPRREDTANIGFIVGRRCVAVIDSGGSVRIGRRLLAAIRTHTPLPVCYVINTHVHYDHILGNAAFLDEGSEFVGHAGLAGAVAGSEEFFRREFAAELGRREVVAPTRLVERQLLLDLGGRKLRLQSWPAAHTGEDLTVLDMETGTLWTGDLLFRERLPVIDGSLKGWLAAMAEMEQLAAVQIVPGHGPPAGQWKEAAADQTRYLRALLEETRAMVARGAFLEEALDTVARQEEGRWTLFDQGHRRNVSRAFLELEWE